MTLLGEIYLPQAHGHSFIQVMDLMFILFIEHLIPSAKAKALLITIIFLDMKINFVSTMQAALELNHALIMLIMDTKKEVIWREQISLYS